jgi:hypothetical protein
MPEIENKIRESGHIPTQGMKEDILKLHWRREVKAQEEKEAMYGGLFSTLSTASVTKIRQENASNLDGDPLKLWKAILRTHKTWTQHMNTFEAKMKLQNEFSHAYQRRNESLEDYADRFKRLFENYKKTLVEEARPTNAEAALKHVSALDRVI